MQSKRPRETPTDLEHMENDELRRMGTSSTTNKRKSDQPEESTVREQRVDDVAMDQGPRDAGVSKMRMDEMLMEDVRAKGVALVRVKASDTRLKCTLHESGEVTENVSKSRVNPAVENFFAGQGFWNPTVGLKESTVVGAC